MRTQGWLYLGCWYAAHVLALNFLRFRWGVIPLSIASVTLGCLGYALLFRGRVSRPGVFRS